MEHLTFPGASHIYRVGATGFFLDCSAAIKLTEDQQATLYGIKEKSIGDLGAAQRRIDQVEQELWMLTGSDRPDSTLEMKVREIERLKGDQRIAFIRAVGEAARVLTDDQRAALLGPGAPGGHVIRKALIGVMAAALLLIALRAGAMTAEEHASHHPGGGAAAAPAPEWPPALPRHYPQRQAHRGWPTVWAK